MKSIRRKAAALLAALGLCLGLCLPAEAADPLQAAAYYEDGDVVGFIGDSITHGLYCDISYVEALQQYYLSRFPEREVEFRNLSAAGYRASLILDIYDQDPAFQGINKAVIMLGTNEAILGISTEDYIRDMAALVEKLKSEGVPGEDILILSPPICDEDLAQNQVNGSPYWAFEDTLLAYMEELEEKAADWGVHYLDIHTPMAELTRQIQVQSLRNSLTKDSIHPNASGNLLIAYCILEYQGAGTEPMSRISVSGEDTVEVNPGKLSRFYRGEHGLCWKLNMEVLPFDGTEELLTFLELYQPANSLYQELLQVDGLKADANYQVFFGDTQLCAVSGAELEEGIDLAMLETHPLYGSVQQIEAWNRDWHQTAVNYRNVWVNIMTQEVAYTTEQIQAEYESWEMEDELLRVQMYGTAHSAAEETYQVMILEEGFSREELMEEAEEAIQRMQEMVKRSAEDLMQQKIMHAVLARD